MRTLVAAALTIAALTALTISAEAQSQRPKFGATESQPTDDGRAVVDEKKYKAAVDRLGGSRGKYDPWANMREKPPAK
ncbi:MAG: hypothetical protein ABSG76_01020 [Xanthobacteraceae bacterium]|jgi:hypothetical protein